MLSTKLLNKKTNKKLKSVTIIHSATTETVRLPEDNNGVIVHTAVRSKVPLKQKVRGERKKKSPTSGGGDHKKKSGNKTTPSATNASGAEKSGNSADRKETASGGAVRPKRKKTAVRSPHQQQQKKLLSLYKSKSKKEIIDYSNRADKSSPLASTSADLSAIGKVQKWLLESPANAGNEGENSSIISGDVLQSNNNAAMAMESLALKKSISTPERLVGNNASASGGAMAKKVKKPSYHNPSATQQQPGQQQQEKVKLQVVYKPPFKFSLKLKKRSPVTTTTVVAPYRAKKGNSSSSNNNKSRSAVDKNRIGIMSSSSQDKNTILRKSRLALLIRKDGDGDEEMADMTTSKADDVQLLPSGGGDRSLESYNTPHRSSSRHYENMDNGQKPVNSATFRIKKSASSGNAGQLERNAGREERRQRTGSSTMKSNNSKDSMGADTTTMASDRSRDISIGNNSGGNGSRGSTLMTQFGGSSGNLVMRSSTTNLAKLSGFQKNERGRNSLNMQRQLSSPADSSFRRTSDSNSNVLLGRNATATSIQNNLHNGNMIMFKKLSTSNTNLAKFSDEFLAKRASNTSLNNAGVSRRSSVKNGSNNSKGNNQHTPKRRASINNSSQRKSPQGGATGSHSTSGTFDRRASMGSHNTKKSKGSHSTGRTHNHSSSRPHTAACDVDRVAFEWPPPPPPAPEIPRRMDEPLPSDLEVMCSDVEHAFQDR